MLVRTYVISLKDEELRRSKISEQLNSIGQDFLFFDAIDFREAADSTIMRKYNFSQSSSVRRSLTKGEIGCALSHMGCYRKLLNSEYEWAWIIEDDAILSDINSRKINDLIQMAGNYNCDAVILGYSKLRKSDYPIFNLMEPINKVASKNGLALGMPWKNWTCGTVSYLINRAGAQKILKKYSGDIVETVADDWLFLQKEYGLNIFHCRPLLVFENFEGMLSSIETERSVVSAKKMKYLDGIRVLRGIYRFLIMQVFNR